MDKLEFSSVDDFEKCVIESLNDFTDDEYPAICVYGKFEFIKETLETLLANGVKIHNSIELEDYEISGYDKEFELMLTQDGVAVSKMWHEDNEYHKAGYYDTGADVVFVHEYCCSNIVLHIECDEIYEVAIDECGENGCICGSCIKSNGLKIDSDSGSFSVHDNGDVTIKSYEHVYKVNNKKVSKEEYNNKSYEFDEIFNYVMNRMNDMFRRF